jgi:hypothetical protein
VEALHLGVTQAGYFATAPSTPVLQRGVRLARLRFLCTNSNTERPPNAEISTGRGPV